MYTSENFEFIFDSMFGSDEDNLKDEIKKGSFSKSNSYYFVKKCSFENFLTKYSNVGKIITLNLPYLKRCSVCTDCGLVLYPIYFFENEILYHAKESPNCPVSSEKYKKIIENTDYDLFYYLISKKNGENKYIPSSEVSDKIKAADYILFLDYLKSKSEKNILENSTIENIFFDRGIVKNYKPDDKITNLKSIFGLKEKCLKCDIPMEDVSLNNVYFSTRLLFEDDKKICEKCKNKCKNKNYSRLYSLV